MCDRCSEKTKKSCKKHRYYYIAEKAEAKSKKTRTDSRKGIRLTQEELQTLDELLSPRIRQGQPLSHIFNTHGDELPVSLRSIYNYIDAGELTVCNLDLRRKVKYRKPRKKSDEIKCNKFNYRQGRTYDDFKKDQQRGATPDVRVSFDFKHALACIGDRITVSCDESVKTRLKGVYTLSDVELTVTRLTFDYQLTRKGRLVLNNSSQPNWQAVESEDTKVHRTLVFTPDLVMARATSRDAATTTDFDSGSGHGIFYIPIESGNTKQQVTVTADYTVTSGDPTEMLDEGSVSTDIDLSFVHNASEGRNMSITLRIPESECSGTPLNGAALGQIICSHGRAHAATDGVLSCGGEKVAVVAYVGDASGEVSPFNHGLAIALQDADAHAWCSQKAETCLEAQAGDLASALTAVNGLTATALLVADDAHLHTAAVAAYNYRFDGAVRSGAHPAGTSRWFLPSMGQWNLMVKAIAGSDTDLSGNQNADYKATAVSPFFTDRGGDALQSALYWSSTEKSTSDAWYVSFENGKAQGGDKDETYRVRPVLAF